MVAIRHVALRGNLSIGAEARIAEYGTKLRTLASVPATDYKQKPLYHNDSVAYRGAIRRTALKVRVNGIERNALATAFEGETCCLVANASTGYGIITLRYPSTPKILCRQPYGVDGCHQVISGET